MSKGSKAKWSQELDLKRERSVLRYDLAKWILSPFIWIVSLWVPLQGALPIANAIAGHKTTLTVSFSITIVVSLTATGAMVAMFVRGRERQKEIERLRILTEGLEAG